jgi:hypothetical protein
MAQLAMDTANSAELRGRMYAELAQYVYPKRRACEVKGEGGPKIVFHLDTVGSCDDGPRSTEVDRATS